jgi:hypothetical protein
VTAKKKKIESIENQVKILSKVKKYLKKDPVIKEICDEYGRRPEDLDGVSITFDSKLDVTAKTVDGKMFLNTSLLDEKFEILCRYVVHELTHVFQHMEKEFRKNRAKREKEYLERPEEIEAFQNQIKFDANNRSEEEAKKYVNKLLRYHEVKDEEEADSKRKELLKKLK